MKHLSHLMSIAALLVFTDHVLRLNLDQTSGMYRVAFKRHAAYYRVGKDRPAATCLLEAVEKGGSVRVQIDPKDLVIKSCSVVK